MVGRKLFLLMTKLFANLGKFICPLPFFSPIFPLAVTAVVVGQYIKKKRMKDLYLIAHLIITNSIQELILEYHCSSDLIEVIYKKMEDGGVFNADFFKNICDEEVWLYHPEEAKEITKLWLRQFFA